MAIATFRMNIPAGAWTLVADGVVSAFFGIQVTDGLPVKIAMAPSVPAVDIDNFMMIGGENERSLAMNLDTGTKVYAMGLSGPVEIRGYRD